MSCSLADFLEAEVESKTKVTIDKATDKRALLNSGLVLN